MKYSFPRSVTEQMAASAVQNARADALSRGWKTSMALNPISGVGFFGINTTKRYHMYQEMGTKPYLMTSLEGKTVPISGPDGTHFVKVRGVGEPGFVNIPGRGRVWRDQKWRHPGLKPTNLMANAINQSVQDNQDLIKQLMLELMGQETETKLL